MAGSIVEAPDAEVQVARRAEAWRLRRGMWGLAEARRLQTCGRAARGDAVRIDVATSSDGTRRAAVGGLVSCSSIWCCPVCSRTIRAERERDLRQGATNHADFDGGLVFATFTLRHVKADGLADLLGVLMDSWRAIQQSREWRREGAVTKPDGLKARLGIVGWVRAIEVTYGRRGWHPHLHVLFFTGRPITQSERDDLHAWLESQWITELVRRGRSGKAGVAVDVRRVVDDPTAYERIAGYAVKGEKIALEVARSDFKAGRRSSINTTQLLDAAVDGEAWAVRAWQEYERATSGRRAIEWSRGLRTLVGLCEHERPDDEVVEDVAAEGGDVVEVELVAVLTAFEWAALCAAGRDYEAVRSCETFDGLPIGVIVEQAVEVWHRRRGSPG